MRQTRFGSAIQTALYLLLLLAFCINLASFTTTLVGVSNQDSIVNDPLFGSKTKSIATLNTIAANALFEFFLQAGKNLIFSMLNLSVDPSGTNLMTLQVAQHTQLQGPTFCSTPVLQSCYDVSDSSCTIPISSSCIPTSLVLDHLTISSDISVNNSNSISVPIDSFNSSQLFVQDLTIGSTMVQSTGSISCPVGSGIDLGSCMDLSLFTCPMGMPLQSNCIPNNATFTFMTVTNQLTILGPAVNCTVANTFAPECGSRRLQTRDENVVLSTQTHSLVFEGTGVTATETSPGNILLTIPTQTSSIGTQNVMLSVNFFGGTGGAYPSGSIITGNPGVVLLTGIVQISPGVFQLQPGTYLFYIRTTRNGGNTYNWQIDSGSGYVTRFTTATIEGRFMTHQVTTVSNVRLVAAIGFTFLITNAYSSWWGIQQI